MGFMREGHLGLYKKVLINIYNTLVENLDVISQCISWNANFFRPKYRRRVKHGNLDESITY